MWTYYKLDKPCMSLRIGMKIYSAYHNKVLEILDILYTQCTGCNYEESPDFILADKSGTTTHTSHLVDCNKYRYYQSYKP